MVDPNEKVAAFLRLMIERHGGSALARKLGVSRQRLYQMRDTGAVVEPRCKALRDICAALESTEPKGLRVRPLTLPEIRPDVWSEPDAEDRAILDNFGGEREIEPVGGGGR